MFFPAKMAEVEVLVHDSVKYDVLRVMQRSGFMHVVHHQIENLDNSRPSEDISRIVDYEFRISKLMGILNTVKRKGEGIKEMLNPTPPEKFDTIPRRREEILEDAARTLAEVEEEILRVGAEWDKIGEEIEHAKKKIEYLEMLSDFNIKVEHLGEGLYVNVMAGTVKDAKPLLKLKREGKLAVWIREIGKKKSIIYVAVLAYHLKDRKEVESALRFATFTEFDLYNLKGSPKEAMQTLKKRVEDLKKEREGVREKLVELRKKHYPRLAILFDDLDNEKIKEEYQNRFGKTNYTTVIRGYIPFKRLNEARNKIEKASGGLAIIRHREAKGEDVPTAFDNPRILKPFQAFVEMYSIPKYGYIDPTAIIAPLFVAYFGLTLGDAGYGLIITILGYLLWFRIGKYDWTNRTLGKILFASGISAIVFGLLQGGIFGPLDKNNPISKFIKYTPVLDPMTNAVQLLVISLIVGIAQISLGLILGAYHHLKYRNYGDFLTSELSWFFLLPGGGIVIGVMFKWWSVDPLLLNIGWLFVILGLIFLTGIPAKIIEKGSAINAMAFFDITGMVGDWLSFSRLLALDLGTSGIALTINLFAGIMSSMITGTGSMVCCLPLLIVGIVMLAYVAKKRDKVKLGIAVFLFILGAVGMVNLSAALWLFIGVYMVAAHIGNALLQSLGSLVHSLRLQYVEFFSKFYVGDGVKFEPFREIRKHSRIVESGGAER